MGRFLFIMNTECMMLVWNDEYYKQDNKTKLLVALAIASSSNNNHESEMAVPEIARLARCSERAVQLACREMWADGKMTVLSSGDSINKYVLVFEKAEVVK